jgi:hypothetical protein
MECPHTTSGVPRPRPFSVKATSAAASARVSPLLLRDWLSDGVSPWPRKSIRSTSYLCIDTGGEAVVSTRPSELKSILGRWLAGRFDSTQLIPPARCTVGELSRSSSQTS